MMEENNDVFKLERVQEAVDSVIGLFADRGLTVAECCKAVKVLDVTFKAEYPEVYKLMNGK